MAKGNNEGPDKPARKSYRKGHFDAETTPYISLWLRSPNWIIHDISMPSAALPIPAALVKEREIFAQLPHLRQRLGKALRTVWQSGMPVTINVPTHGGMLPCFCAPDKPQPLADLLICSLPLALFGPDMPLASDPTGTPGWESMLAAPPLIDILDTLHLGLIHIDLEGRVLAINAPLQRLSPARAGDILPLDSHEYHPAWQWWDGAGYYRWCDLPLARVLQDYQPIEEFVLYHDRAKDRRTLYLAKAQPFYGEEGGIVGASLLLVALTAKTKEDEVAHRHAAEVLAVVDNIRDGILLYDATGKMWLMNPAAQTMLGWNRVHADPLEVPIGMRAKAHDVRLNDGQPLDPEDWPVNRALRGESTEVIELSIKRLDGVRISVGVSATPLHAPDTQGITGAVAIIRDMTQHHRFEKLREDFMSMASHELRTPLTSLALAQRIMQRHLVQLTKDEKLLDLNDDLLSQIHLLNRLVDNLLDMTGLTGGRFELHTKLSDLAKIIREVVKELHVMSKRTQHTIILTGLDEPIWAIVDPRRFSQVIFNLVTNAMKFSPTKTPVEIEAHYFEREGEPWLSIDITDYGIGIPPDQLPTLFERMLDAEEVDRASGMGYSLFLSRAIIRRHGGNITVNSVYHFGSTFSLLLPVTSVVEGSPHEPS